MCAECGALYGHWMGCPYEEQSDPERGADTRAIRADYELEKRRDEE